MIYSVSKSFFRWFAIVAMIFLLCVEVTEGGPAVAAGVAGYCATAYAGLMTACAAVCFGTGTVTGGLAGKKTSHLCMFEIFYLIISSLALFRCLLYCCF